jgi:hypothetical protein
LQLDVVTVDGMAKTDPNHPARSGKEKLRHFFMKYFWEGEISKPLLNKKNVIQKAPEASL